MSATTDDVQVDLDEVERKLAEEKMDSGAAVEPAERQILEPEDGIEAVKKQLEDERNARIEAERLYQEAAQSEVAARTDSQQNQLHLMTNAIEKFEQSNTMLKSNYKQALQDQDFDAAADIQMQMSENAANLLQLKQGKQALERQPKPRPRPPTDIVEQFVTNMTPASANWVRKHREYVTDAKKNAKMIAAHNFIKDEVEVDSPRYFKEIERMLGIRTEEPLPTEEDDPMADAAKPIRRAQPAAAPVTRSGNGAGTRSNSMVLSGAEREIAQMNGMTDEEYAKNKVALKKEGRLN